jgi:hypothetical protein
MKSRLESVAAFVYRLSPGGNYWHRWSSLQVKHIIRERDRMWERMLADLYKESKKARR